MKSVQLIETGRPLEERDVPTPELGAGELLVRVEAAGICHSDAHYRSGVSPAGPLPITLGHEVAGIVEKVDETVASFAPGDRVCLHYLVTCGSCPFCGRRTEQFCTRGQMLGKDRDGGYAELIAIPARSVFRLPEAIPFTHGAVLMCSSATALHALRKARMERGESVAVFGVGGLGVSAIQIAWALGAGEVYAVDLREPKLALVRSLGATAIDASVGDAADQIREITFGRGVDVAVELIGLPATMRQAVRSLGKLGGAALAGLTDGVFEVSPYDELLNREAEIIGVSDHLADEIPTLLELAERGQLDLTTVVSETVPLDAAIINERLDRLEDFSDAIRFVICPGSSASVATSGRTLALLITDQ